LKNYSYLSENIYSPNNYNYMKELLDAIKAEIEVFSKNAEAQLVKGNKAAGTRARKAALNLSKMMKEFRKVSMDASR
jgi:hypothetical protein